MQHHKLKLDSWVILWKTWLESSHFSQRDSSRVRVTKSCDSSRIIDSYSAPVPKGFKSGSGSGNFSKLESHSLFRLRLQSKQAKVSNGFTLEITTQTSATAEIEKWLQIWGRFSKICDSWPGCGQKRRILPETSPALRNPGHLVWLWVLIRKDERTVKFFIPSPVLIQWNLNPIQTWTAKFLKIIGPIQTWPTNVKPFVHWRIRTGFLFCPMRQRNYWSYFGFSQMIGWRQNSFSSAFASWGKSDTAFWHFENQQGSVYFASEGKALLELFCH